MTITTSIRFILLYCLRSFEAESYVAQVGLNLSLYLGPSFELLFLFFVFISIAQVPGLQTCTITPGFGLYVNTSFEVSSQSLEKAAL